LILDLDLVLLKNLSGEGFVLGDDPVVFHNQLLEGADRGTVGLQSVGLQIYFPLSPDHALLFFDPTTYVMKDRKGATAFLKSLSDIRQINALTTLQARHAFFFDPQRTSNAHLAELRERLASVLGSPRVSMRVFVRDPAQTEKGVFVLGTPRLPGEEEVPREELALLGRRIPNLHLALSLLKPRGSRLRERALLTSRPEPRNEEMVWAHRLFREQVERSRWKHWEFLDFLKEYQFRMRLEGSSFDFPWR
jgi:hypothetical protein